MKRVLIFDVNETLLDLKALDEHFVRIFGDAAVRGQWFGQFLQSAMVTTITGRYVPFGQVGMAALEMVALRRGVSLTDADRQAIREGISRLPPHPEVPAALQQLRSAGFRLASLTNSTSQVAETQMKNASLFDLFDRVLSADAVRRLKPAAEPYHYAAQQMGVTIDRLRMVAAHAWDIAGAMRAGCAAAFIARPGIVLDPLSDTPDIVGKDLQEVAQKIIAAE